MDDGESEEPAGHNADDFKRRRKPDNIAKSPEEEQLRREWLRHEAVMKAIADPTTAEGAIAHKAYQRIAQITKELGLEPPLVELAHQAAQILLMMRPDNEVPSDFQDYTLIAIVAIAAHLSGLNLGEGHGLPLLASKYKQDTTALEQVFDYIMQSLANYRSMHERFQLMLRNGTAVALPTDGPVQMGAVQPAVQAVMTAHQETRTSNEPQPDSVPAAVLQPHKVDTPTASAEQIIPAAIAPVPMANIAAPTAAPMVSTDPLDAFQSRLMSILSADYTALAAAAGPLDVVTPIQGLIVGLSTDETGMKAIEELQRLYQQRTMMSRIHGIRVSHINEEYQKYMERVRAQAQSAIDKANAQWEQSLAVLTARIETYIHYLQQHHLALQQARQQVAVAQQVAAQHDMRLDVSQVFQHVAQQDAAAHSGMPLSTPHILPVGPPAATAPTAQQVDAAPLPPTAAPQAPQHPLPVAAAALPATAIAGPSTSAVHPLQATMQPAAPDPAATVAPQSQPFAQHAVANAAQATAAAPPSAVIEPPQVPAQSGSELAAAQAHAPSATVGQQPPPLPPHFPDSLPPHLPSQAQLQATAPPSDLSTPPPIPMKAAAVQLPAADAPAPHKVKPPTVSGAAQPPVAAAATSQASPSRDQGRPPAPQAAPTPAVAAAPTSSAVPRSTTPTTAPDNPQQDTSTEPVAAAALPAAPDTNNAMAAYLQQQQQLTQQALLARHLAQPTNLPLKRLSQQAQNQVLSTYQKQQQQGAAPGQQDKRPSGSMGTWTVQSGQQPPQGSNQGYYYGNYPQREATTSQPFTVSSATNHPTIMQGMAVHIVPHNAQKAAGSTVPPPPSSSAGAAAPVRPSVVTGARLPITQNSSASRLEGSRPSGVSVQSGALEGQGVSSASDRDGNKAADATSGDTSRAAVDAAARDRKGPGLPFGTVAAGPSVPPPLPVQGVVVTTGLAVPERRGLGSDGGPVKNSSIGAGLSACEAAPPSPMLAVSIGRPDPPPLETNGAPRNPANYAMQPRTMASPQAPPEPPVTGGFVGAEATTHLKPVSNIEPQAQLAVGGPLVGDGGRHVPVAGPSSVETAVASLHGSKEAAPQLHAAGQAVGAAGQQRNTSQ